jgi:hypothetical protein
MSKNSMKDFFSKMLSGDSRVSSKRVIAIVAIVNIIIFCYIATFLGKTIPEFMFDGLALISGGGMGLTAVESIFNRKKNKNNTDETPPAE